MMFRSLVILLTVSAANSWMTPVGDSSISRRNVMNTITTSGVILLSSPVVAVAMEACPPKSQNCVRTTWTPPSGTSKKDAAAGVKKVLEAYPQEGQDGGKVDGGGWTIAENGLESKGTARVEYRSSGKGNFAKFLNGGKPFTDDLLIEVGDNGVVELRSSSRVGETDFGVNTKRVEYLSKAIEALGWSV